METLIQKARGLVRRAIYDALKDMVKGTTKRGKMVQTLAKRHKIAAVTVNKYFRWEEERNAEATRQFEEAPPVVLGHEAPPVTEGAKEASDFIKRVGGFDYNLPSEANFMIEQMSDNEITITLTLVVPTSRFASVILGLLDPEPLPYG